MTFQEALREAGAEILDKIAFHSVNTYFRGIGTQSDAPGIPGIVTSRSGRLKQAVLNAAKKRDITFSANQAKITIGIGGEEVPYAALIHEGGVRAVTQRMRSFFWAKWYNAGFFSESKSMWSALRFKNNIFYRPRPFLERAVFDMVNEIPEILRKHSIEFLRFEIVKIITGAQKAISPQYTVRS